MTAPDDPGFWSKLAAAASALVVALVGVVFGSVQRRLHGHAARIKALEDDKADKSELDRQRGHVETLYEGQVEIRREIATQSQKMLDTLHGVHVDLLSKIDERRQRR